MEDFKEYIKGCNAIVKKWLIALVVCNVMWAIAFISFVLLAYLAPCEVTCEQSQGEQTQSSQQIGG